MEHRTWKTTSFSVSCGFHTRRRLRKGGDFINSFTDPAYAAAHSVITFQTADGLEKYTVFAVVPVQKTDAWYSFIRAADGSEFAKQVALLQSKSLYDTGVTPVYGQQLLTLSTCYGSGKDGRLIVAAAQL